MMTDGGFRKPGFFGTAFPVTMYFCRGCHLIAVAGRSHLAGGGSYAYAYGGGRRRGRVNARQTKIFFLLWFQKFRLFLRQGYN